MPVKVIDASALAALLFGEPQAEEVATRLEDCTLAAPPLLRFETASVCLKKVRRHPSLRDSLVTAYALVDRFAITQIEVAFPDVIALAEQSRLTVYDASYLWLARSLRAELVTLDAKLARAVKATVLKGKGTGGR